MKKLVTIVISGALAVTLCGCASGSAQSTNDETSSSATASATTNSTEPTAIVLKESGYNITENGYVQYGVLLDNPNSDYGAKFCKVTIVGKKTDGSIVFSTDQVLSDIIPEQQYAYAGQAGNGTAPDTVEFKVSVDKSNWFKSTDTDSNYYTISNISEIPGQYGNDSYTGEITTNIDADVKQVAISVFLRNAAGEICGSAFTFADAPALGETGTFQVNSYKTPEHTSYEIYAEPWY